MARFWMSVNKSPRYPAQEPLCKDSVCIRGSIGKHQYVVACEGVLVRSNQSDQDCLRQSINLDGFWSGGRSESDINIGIDPLGSEIRIHVPLTAVTGMYLHREPDGLCIATDPKLLFHRGMQIDERALYSLLQFGVLIPGLTPWREIAQLMPGSVYAISGDDLRISQWIPKSSSIESVDATLPPSRQCEEIATELDRTLRRLCPDCRPTILFSGGVDSGLLAARAAAMGWRETLLVNIQFGLNDTESAHAEAMARWLGLSYERVRFSIDQLGEYLSRLGTTYPLPFGDISAYPNYLLAHAVAEQYGGHKVVLDGSGADGAFGLFGDWRPKACALPRFIRKMSAMMYKVGRLWMRTCGVERLEYLYNHTSVDLPGLHASIAINALCDIAYHVPSMVRSETRELLDKWLQDCVPWADGVRRFIVLDLVLACCGMMASKDKPIFDNSRIDVRYPYLEPNMVRLAVDRAIYWPGAKTPKIALKNLLAQLVPREMVFRPKSAWGVSAIQTQIVRSPAFLKALDQVSQSTAPLSSVVDHDCIRRLRRCLEQGRPLPSYTYRFLWLAVFTSLWLDQVLHEGLN